MIPCFTSLVCAKANSSLHNSPGGVYHNGRLGSAEDHPRLDDAHAGGADALDDRAHGDELATAVDQFHPVSLAAAELPDEHGLAVGDPVLLLRVGGYLVERQRDLVEGDPRLPHIDTLGWFR